MKKLIAVSSLAVLAFAMLLPAATQVNAAPANRPIFSQGRLPAPPPPGPGGFKR
jgi:hypothetical protein